MADTSNPYIGLSAAQNKMIEGLFARLWSALEWHEEDEELLGQWRDARGDAAKDRWRWWAGEIDGDSYAQDFATKADALEFGRREYFSDGRFQIIEARVWADNVKEGDEIVEFAETRNYEVIETGEPA